MAQNHQSQMNAISSKIPNSNYPHPPQYSHQYFPQQNQNAAPTMAHYHQFVDHQTFGHPHQQSEFFCIAKI
jgi:hypothetical protein